MADIENKIDLMKDLNDTNLTSWIENFITNDVCQEEKITVLKYNKSKLKNLDKTNLSDNYKAFVDLVLKDKLTDALKLSDIMSYKFSPKKYELEETIKSKNIYFLSPKLEIEMGGLGRTVLYRANYLAEEGFKITLLNVGPVKNYDYIKNYFQSKNQYSQKINFINIFEYYSNKNTLGENMPTLSGETSDDIIKIENSDKSVTLNHYDDSKLVKSELYIDGCLVYEESEEFNRYYTKDGFNFLTNDKENKKFILNERKSEISFEFKGKKRFLYHFLDEVCLDLEKPYIVCDSTSHWYDANGISTKDAYKIGALHRSPFVDFLPGNDIDPHVKHLKQFDNLDKVVLLTDDLKKDLADLYDPKKLAVIPNFVFEKDLEYESVEKDKNKLAVFARISAQKNLSDAIRAFEIVSKENENAVLEIYGGASDPAEKAEEEKLKQLVKELKLEDRIIFKGFTNNISEPMQKSLATLLTSKYEGLPMSILESMTNSTAVISYKCYYGPEELISNDVDGILIEQGDIEGFSKAILKLLDNPEIAIEMGKRGKDKITNNYTLSNIAHKWKDLFADIYVESEIEDIVEKATLKDEYESAVKKASKLESENKTLKKDNEKLKKQKSRLEKQNKKLKEYKEEVITSTSWKITKPLRKTMQTIRRK